MTALTDMYLYQAIYQTYLRILSMSLSKFKSTFRHKFKFDMTKMQLCVRKLI